MAPRPSVYIGILSGTSMDGIDVVLADFENARAHLHASKSHEYPADLSRRLKQARAHSHALRVDEVCQLDRLVGLSFAEAVKRLLKESGLGPMDIAAIGSHGQTLRHKTDVEPAFTLQVGDPHTIAAKCRIKTVADFRRRDVALGGQGAPLACAFHKYLCGERDNSGVLNLGGIANLTLFIKGEDARGFDTGPASTLLDMVAQQRLGLDFDANGACAREGRVDEAALQLLLRDPYFFMPEPKSTGFEYFNEKWLRAKMGENFESFATSDLLATLTELTARSIALSINAQHNKLNEVFVCGGGIHNSYLLERLDALCPDTQFESSSVLGADPDWMEAMAFAWLAKETLEGRPGNLVSVTGAREAAVLGAIFAA